MTLPTRKRRLPALLFGLIVFLFILLCGSGLVLLNAWQEGDPSSLLDGVIYLPCVGCFALFVGAGAILLALDRLRRRGDPLI